MSNDFPPPVIETRKGLDWRERDYTNAPLWRGDFFTSDLLPPQRHEHGTVYWRYHDGQSMMYYCPDDPTEEHDADFCRHHYPQEEPQSPGPDL